MNGIAFQDETLVWCCRDLLKEKCFRLGCFFPWNWGEFQQLCSERPLTWKWVRTFLEFLEYQHFSYCHSFHVASTAELKWWNSATICIKQIWRLKLYRFRLEVPPLCGAGVESCPPPPMPLQMLKQLSCEGQEKIWCHCCVDPTWIFKHLYFPLKWSWWVSVDLWPPR